MSAQSEPVHVNGRPWYAKVISEQWGPLLILAGLGGVGLWGIFGLFQIVFTMMEKQTERHAARIDRLVTVIVENVADEQKRTRLAVQEVSALVRTELKVIQTIKPQIVNTHAIAQRIVTRQDSFVPLVQQLLRAVGVRAPRETSPHKGIGQPQPFPGP